MAEAPDTSSSISAAAHAYQLAMSQQQAVAAAVPSASAPINTEVVGSPSGSIKDTLMMGTTSEQPDSPAPATETASPAPQRTGTPIRRENGNDISSRAASQHPDPLSIMPTEAPAHGAPARQYLNSKVTGVLLEGMKQLAKDQPRDPLRVLGEFLLQKSRELEG